MLGNHSRNNGVSRVFEIVGSIPTLHTYKRVRVSGPGDSESKQKTRRSLVANATRLQMDISGFADMSGAGVGDVKPLHLRTYNNF